MRLKSQALASLLQQGPESHRAHAALSLATRMLSQCEAQVRDLAACSSTAGECLLWRAHVGPMHQCTVTVQGWEACVVNEQAIWLQVHSCRVLQPTVTIAGA